MFKRSFLMRNIAQKTYAFYDFETTGLNPVFDQVLRAAFLRTTHGFQEVERAEFTIRLNPDVIPSPIALTVNRLSIAQLLEGESEYAVMKKMHGIVNTPGTKSIGYNSCSFDDQFLRFGFWKNLFAPYAHQYANNCSRMDIYPMTVTYRLLCPEHLQWKIRENGKIGFKLEEMNQANQLVTDGRAHDAMTDVRVTAALAQRLSTHEEMWDFCSRFFNKEADKQEIADCVDTVKVGDDHYQYGLMISHRGKEVIPVLLLGHSTAYPNQTVWLKINDHHALSSPIVFRKKQGEPPFFIPIDGAVAGGLTANDSDFIRNLGGAFESIVNNPTEFSGVRNYYLNFQYEKHDCDVNAKLYALSFPSKLEEELFQEFHEAKLENKPAIAKKFPRTVHRELALRLFGRNFPELLLNADKEKFAQHVACVFSKNAIFVDHTGKARFSIKDARDELEKLSKRELDAEQKDIVKDYECWLDHAVKNKGHVSAGFFANAKKQHLSFAREEKYKLLSR